MALRPSSREERWMSVAARLGLDRGAPWLAERMGGWIAVTLLTRGAFFVLGAVVAGLIAGIFDLLHFRGSLLYSGLAAVVVAEWLILRRRFFGVGVEEALEVAGLLMIAIQEIDRIGDLSGIIAALLMAAVLAVTGWRLLNAFFAALSVVAFSYVISVLGLPRAHLSPEIMAGVFCFAAAWAALYCGRLQFQRPSYERTLNWLVVVMPLAAYWWLAGSDSARYWVDPFRYGAVLRVVSISMLAVFGVVALITGLRRRNHALIIAFMVCCVCLAYELRHLTDLSLKVKLIFWGSVTLVVTLLLDRYLRQPRRGVTSASVTRNNNVLDLLQLAGTTGLAPHSTPPVTTFKGGGGTFGGGGASGNY